jgi:hypothetical protein
MNASACALLGLLSGCGALAVDVVDPGAATLGANTVDTTPDLVLPSTEGDVALADVLARGPAALIFYRGHW